MARLPTPPVAPVTAIGRARGALAVLFHAMNGERGGEPRGAERHGRAGVESLRHRDHPVPGHARELGVAAVVGFGQRAPGHQHRLPRAVAGVGRRLHLAGEIDSAHEREAAQDPAGAGGCERVLVVDAGVGDADHHLARGQVRERELLEARLDAAALGVNAESFERLRYRAHDRVRPSQASRPWVLSSRSPASACSIPASERRQPCSRASFSHRASMASRMPPAGAGSLA